MKCKRCGKEIEPNRTLMCESCFRAWQEEMRMKMDSNNRRARLKDESFPARLD